MFRIMFLCLTALAALSLPDKVLAAKEGQMVNLKPAHLPSFTIYRTGPTAAATGILLSPSSRGFTPAIHRWADRLADAGYRVAVIDPYDGRVFESRRRARKAARKFDHTVRRAESEAVLKLLAAPGRKLITVGWGRFGGHEALMMALADPALVSATIIYHDSQDPVLDPHSLVRLRGAILAIFFNKPQGTAALRSFETAMREAGKPLYVHFYPGQVTLKDFAGASPGDTAKRLAWNETTGFIQDVQRYCRRCAGYYYRR
ncbi:MAG: dienelactone hydrolase family protein [Acidiferrobacteraceae bacterium]